MTIIQIYMKGDLRYNCGGNVDLCMDKPVFKRKIYDEIYEWKENRSDKYALLIKEQDELVNQLLQRNLQKRV